MAKGITSPITGPTNSSDVEARKLLAQRATATIPGTPLTKNNGAAAGLVKGTKVTGGAKLSGGSV